MNNRTKNEKDFHWKSLKDPVGQIIWENICKWWDWEGINSQNIQRAHIAPYQKKKTTWLKNEQKTEIDISTKT